MKDFLPIALILLTTQNLWSMNDETLGRLRRNVAQALTLSGFQQSILEEDVFSSAIRSCDFELRLRRPPLHCYLVVAVRVRYMSKTGGSGTEREALDLQCQKYVQNVTNPRALVVSHDLAPYLTKSCSRAIEERVSDLRYQMQDQILNESDVFQDIGPVQQLLQ